MKERLSRLKVIRKVIKTYRIESQEELLGYLQKKDINRYRAIVEKLGLRK